MLKLLKRFPVIAKESGAYYSFPTLVKRGDTLFLAVRNAVVDEREAHGREGVISVYRASVTDLEYWQPIPFDSNFDVDERWDLDAILSSVGGQLYLQSRKYKHDSYNETFFSQLSLDEAAQRLLEIERGSLASVQPFLSASYGHLVRGEDGALLLPAYGGLSESGITSPLLFHSYDDGASWQLRAVVANSDSLARYLNEYSMHHLGGKQWLALIRDNHKPSILWQSHSDDDGFSWGELTDSGLRGHAPMLCGTASGIVAIYRDLSGPTPGIGFAYKAKGHDQWESAGISRNYEGALYNGGYGDLVNLGENRLFAAYYVADADESPWIEGAILAWDDQTEPKMEFGIA